MFDIEKSIAFLLAKNHQRAFRIFREKLFAFGITPPQFATLAFLWKNNILNQVELGKLMEVDRNTLSGIIDRLEDAGLVQRVHDPNDRRAWNLMLTQKGKEKQKDLIPIALEVNSFLVENLTLEEKELLLTLLIKIRKNKISEKAY
ncbi:MarR family winged helix-turn-helix transcriptional regulator [Desulfolucanica intricata]|uniref:MarR family winged helix-turn-helix transcriptional regulator n=1 Tax=Desulfolucanica intricata TaxID=1285191 RepID=UPI000831A9D9|nr:MarR family transcriptional regulator [Desulfolucanica intricata]